jgi:hypothetical protein
VGPRAVSAGRRGRGRAQKTIELLDACARILEEIQPCTVRAVCYRLVHVDRLLPSMDKVQTDKISRLLTIAREQEQIPWEWIVDETRRAERYNNGFRDPASFVETVKESYRKNYWTTQPHRIEVWSEKGTVRGTLGPVLSNYGITFRVMHGHGSATAVHAVAEESMESVKPLIALYVGDHDCSGMHMSQIDLPTRLERYGGNVMLRRVAIREEDRAGVAQVPSFPANERDPRYAWYVERYGARCWELDALSPPILRDRIEEEILGFMDLTAWARAMEVERAEQASMKQFFDDFGRVFSGKPRNNSPGEKR